MATPNGRAQQRSDGMPIEGRDLKAGTVLVARYKKQDRTCEVVETPDGVRYRLDDGREHKSPSSTGKAAMDGVACNGWRFWSVQGSEPARREPKAKKPATSATAKPTKKVSAKKKPAAKKNATKKPRAKANRAAS